MEWHKGCHGWVMTPIFGEKKIHWATYPQAITDSSCLSSPTSTWIINKCLEKKHLFLQIIYRESIHYLQLGYYPKLWAPGLFNSLACSMAWRNFKGNPWSLEIVPPACAAKVLKKVVSWHQSLGDGGLDCYKGTDTLHTQKISFLHYYGCQKIEDFGLKLFQQHLAQVEKGCVSNKFGPFTLPMPRTSSSPCHIVGVVAHLPRAWSGGLWDLHASWVVSSAWIWMASLLMALGSLIMAKLQHGTPTYPK